MDQQKRLLPLSGTGEIREINHSIVQSQKIKIDPRARWLQLAHLLTKCSLPSLLMASWKCWDDWFRSLQGVDCSSTGRVVNLTIANFVGRGGPGNFSVNPKAKNIGASLGALSELQNLIMYNVNFTAPIPKEWGNLRKLVTLMLQNSQFTGELPSSLGQLTELQSFSLYGASFTNGMPASFCNLVELTNLYLSGANLQSVPACLSSKLTKLTQLGLSYNQLKGPFPTWVTLFPALTELDLSLNQLSGPIPAAIGNMKKLVYLYLGSNQLSGHIPGTVGGLSSLNYLDVYNNSLTGPLPKEFSQLKNLTGLLYRPELPHWTASWSLWGTATPVDRSILQQHHGIHSCCLGKFQGYQHLHQLE